jgi:hypothetical protein
MVLDEQFWQLVSLAQRSGVALKNILFLLTYSIGNELAFS